jgi:hypothetical protein
VLKNLGRQAAIRVGVAAVKDGCSNLKDPVRTAGRPPHLSALFTRATALAISFVSPKGRRSVPAS